MKELALLVGVLALVVGVLAALGRQWLLVLAMSLVVGGQAATYTNFHRRARGK